MRQRVLLVAIDYPPSSGGIARLLGGLVDSTADTVEWKVLTTAAGLDEPGVIRVSGNRALWAAIPSQARWLRSTTRRLVVCGHVYAFPPALVASRLASAPLGTLAYGMEIVPHRLSHRIVLGSLRAGGRVVAISRHTAKAVQRFGLSGDHIRVVNPAPKPPWPLPQDYCRRRSDEGLRLVIITRLAEGYKNLELPLRMVSILAPQQVVSQLTIIGDGPRRSALQQTVTALGIEAHVTFAGQVSDDQLASILKNSHLGLFPSRASLAEGGFEGFGLAIHEMGAAGLPVLVGRAAGATDAAVPEWSILLDPDDLRVWTSTVASLAIDEITRSRMARAALAWAQMVDHSGVARDILFSLCK